MPTRRYKSDPALLLAQGRMIVSSSDDARFLHKVEIVTLVLSGLTPSFLSPRCGDSKNAITGWVKTVDEHGFDALRTKKQPGRRPKLSPEQLSHIRDLLAEDNPNLSGVPVWDGPSLSRYIQETWAVTLCVRQCQRLLHTLGCHSIPAKLV